MKTVIEMAGQAFETPGTEPSREQTKQIVDGLQRCHHPDSKHEFLRTWVRDWTAHKTTPPAAQREWVELTTDELDEIDKSIRKHGHATIAEIYRAIEAKLKEQNT